MKTKRSYIVNWGYDDWEHIIQDLARGICDELSLEECIEIGGTEGDEYDENQVYDYVEATVRDECEKTAMEWTLEVTV